MGTARPGRASGRWLLALLVSVVATGGDVAVNLATGLRGNPLAGVGVGVLVVVGSAVTVWVERREAGAAVASGLMPALVTNAMSGSVTGSLVQAESIGRSTLAAELYASHQGVEYIRTHDVAAIRDALTVFDALHAYQELMDKPT